MRYDSIEEAARAFLDAFGGNVPDWLQNEANALAVALEKAGEPDLPRVMVVIEGGLISDVLSDVPLRWFHIDYDTDGASPDELYAIPQSDGGAADAFRSDYGSTTVDPAFMDRAMAAPQGDDDDSPDEDGLCTHCGEDRGGFNPCPHCNGFNEGGQG